MEIIVDMNNKHIRLLLANRGKTSDEVAWEENHSISRSLLAGVEKLLRKNGLKLDKISNYKIISNVPEKYTSFRIAKITLECLALAKNRSMC